MEGRLPRTDGSSKQGSGVSGLMGKGQHLPGLHVGWIKSPPGLVAGGLRVGSATAGPASIEATSL